MLGKKGGVWAHYEVGCGLTLTCSRKARFPSVYVHLLLFSLGGWLKEVGCGLTLFFLNNWGVAISRAYTYTHTYIYIYIYTIYMHECRQTDAGNSQHALLSFVRVWRPLLSWHAAKYKWTQFVCQFSRSQCPLSWSSLIFTSIYVVE